VVLVHQVFDIVHIEVLPCPVFRAHMRSENVSRLAECLVIRSYEHNPSGGATFVVCLFKIKSEFILEMQCNSCATI
jgi:hypothetical protein